MTKAADLSALGSNVTTAGNLSSNSTLTLQTNSTTALTINSSQQVGIGTTSPSTLLSLYNATNASLNVSSDTFTNIISARYSTDSGAPFMVLRKGRGTSASPTAVASGDALGQFIFQGFGGTNNRNLSQVVGFVDTYTSDTNISSGLYFSTSPSGSVTATERMRITSAGNVGIGTASPVYNLDVQTASGQASIGIKGGTDRGNLNLLTGAADGDGAAIGTLSFFGGASTSGSVENRIALIGVSAEGTTTNNRGGRIAFNIKADNVASLTERMRIDSTGNVGIGTTSPATKLDVNGVMRFSYGNSLNAISSGGSNAPILSYQTWSSIGNITVLQNPFSDIVFATNTTGTATERMRIHSSGGVSIGNTTDPGNTNLSVTGAITTGGNTVLSTAGGQTIAARTVQQGSQNVGTMLTASGSLGGLELVTPGGANAAFMTFHRAGSYASYFGIDTDNQFAVGGWSAGAALGLFKAGSLGIGTTASGTAGEIRATNNITAFFSDARLKDFKGTIPNALAKVQALNGYYFTENEKAKELGYNNDKMQVGVSAQEVEAVLPEVIADAPINANFEGADYKTVYYDKLVPLLIEAIKELKAEIDELKGK